MTTDEQIAAIRERMAEWDSETCYYTVIHFDHAQAIEDIRFLLAAVDDRDAMIAKLTAERDAAAEVNSKWIWRIGDAIGCDGSWGEVLNAIIAMRIERDAAAAKERERCAEVVNWAHEAHPLACRWDFETMMQVHADAIARVEQQGENNA